MNEADKSIDGKIGLPSTPRPKANKTPSAALPSPVLSSKEEVTFRASRSISRTTKPPSLHLQRSNGSTAASISSISTNADDSPLGPSKFSSPPPIPSLSKARNSRDKQQNSIERPADGPLTQQSNFRIAKHASKSRDSFHRKPLPLAKSPQDDRPLPSLPAPTPPPEKALPQINTAIHTDNIAHEPPDLSETSIVNHDTVTRAHSQLGGVEDEMKRFKDMVKRKPLRSDSNATISPTTNNVINKENRSFHSSPTLGTFISGMIHPSKPNLTDTSNQTLTVTSKSISKEPSTHVSPADSTVQLPNKLPPQAPASISQETVIAALRDDSSEDEFGEVPSTPRAPPALLPQASPTIEESPSKYGVEKGVEETPQETVDKSARNRRSRAASGIDQYKVSCYVSYPTVRPLIVNRLEQKTLGRTSLDCKMKVKTPSRSMTSFSQMRPSGTSFFIHQSCT
jgi:hypothetical protein